jgi:hypothetical protein
LEVKFMADNQSYDVRPADGFAIRGLNQHGLEFWYTGFAGDAWVSRDPEEALVYQTLEEARRKAAQLNVYDSELTGLRFMVPVGEKE